MSENNNYIEALTKGGEKTLLDIYNAFYPKIKSVIINKIKLILISASFNLLLKHQRFFFWIRY